MRRRAIILAPALLPACTATVTDFERTLAAHDSATAALGDWCETHGIAAPATIRAERIAGEMAPPAEVAAVLDAAPEERIAFRHVRLTCGSAVLSVARNWYRPALLTEGMNARLDSSDVPFGKVVGALGFRRELLSSQQGGSDGCPEGTVLTQRALLRLPDGRAFAALVECYQQAILPS